MIWAAVIFIVSLVTLLLGIGVSSPRPFEGWPAGVAFCGIIASGTVLAIHAF